MRTTLTLDDDVAASLHEVSRKSGESFKQVVNDTIRRGLASRRTAERAGPFRLEPRDLGPLRSGVSLDDIGALLEAIEGAEHK